MPRNLLLLHRYLDDQFDVIIRAAEQGNSRPLLEKFALEGNAEDGFIAQFLQYVTAAWSMFFAHGRGDLKDLGDWIGWSVASEVRDEHSQEMHLQRMPGYFSDPELRSWGRFFPTGVVFFGAFYYYARRRAAMREVGLSFWVCAQQTFETATRQTPAQVQAPDAYLGISMLAWAVVEAPPLARLLTPVVEAGVDIQFSRKVRAIFCLGLATNAGSLSSHESVHWARRALDEFRSELVNEQATQMLVTARDPTNDVEAAEVIAEMLRSQRQAREALGPIPFLRYAIQRSDVIRPFFLRAARGTATARILDALRAWHAFDESVVLHSERVLISFPYAEEGAIFLLGAEKVEVRRQSQAVLEELTWHTNAFLGAAMTVTGADNSHVVVPDRPGVPRIEAHIGFQESVRVAMCPIAFPEGWNPDTQIVIPPEGHPLQAMQDIVWGRTWPLSASLQQRRPDRRIQRVLLWSGSGTLTEQLELDFVRGCLEKLGAEVITRIAEDEGVEEFLRDYGDASFDVFWVMSHAELDHWSAHEASLQISRTRNFVTLEHLLARAPQTEGRRLLFLNACDAGRFEHGGLLPVIGLGSGVAGPSQAVISHLWPVMHFPSAAFGALVAAYLSAGSAFFEGFHRALHDLRAPAHVIGARLEELTGLSTELTQRLRVRDEDFSPLELCGSPVFYE